MAKRAVPANDGFASWGTQLRKGVIELMILELVRARRLHGYAIVRELKDRGELVAGEGTVYPVLRRLEADGLVSTAWSDEGPAGPRKYYSLTADGRAFLTRARAEWDGIVAAMDNVRGDAE